MVFTRRDFCRNLALSVGGIGLAGSLYAEEPGIDLCWVLGPLSPPGFVPCRSADGTNLCRGVGRVGLLWGKRHLKIAFEGGTSEQRQAVASISQEWTRYAAIRFEFGQHAPADVVIAFAPNAGHWSYLGTNAVSYARAGRPSMNLQWNRNTEDQEKRRTCLHEFGHMIGLEHEHLSPQAPIVWNKKRVYDHYWRTQRWSPQEVDFQVLERVNEERHLIDAFDPKSIMLYRIPPELTLNGFESKWNTELSAMDKRFIALLYPDENQRSAKEVYEQALVAFRDGDFRAAFAQWQPLAQQDYPDAMLAVANLYMTGRGVSRNPNEAFGWYRRAAELGVAVAHVELGLLLEIGEPSGQIRTDPEAARQHYQIAAEKGNADGMFYLALCYLQGIGGPIRRDTGIGLLKRAARDRDHRMAQRRLNTLGEVW